MRPIPCKGLTLLGCLRVKKLKVLCLFFFFLFFPILQQGECHAVVLKAVMTQPKTLTEEETLHPSALR